MAAGIEIYNYVTNQKGSPAIYSDTLANRPAAGFIGRLFVSIDTFEIYRDNGTGWDLIGSGGGSVNIYNSDGSLTAARTMTMAGHTLTFEGGASTARLVMSANNNVPRIFSFRTANSPRWAFRVDDNETGSNAGANWYLRAYDDAGAFTINPISVERASGEKSMLAVETLSVGSANLTGLFNVAGATYQAGLTMTGGNPHGASHNNFTLANVGNITFANSIYLGAQSNVLRLQANNSGTITLSAASPGIRTASATLNQVQYNTSTGAAITYTHASVMQTLGFYRLVAAGSLTVTNAYGLIVNDLNEYGYAATGGGALVLTNRWGIYQDSTTDVNYLGGTTLIGTTTNNGRKLQVNGGIFANSNVDALFYSVTGIPIVGLGGTVAQFAPSNYWTDVELRTNNISRLRIDVNGNVGIGTNTPTYTLEVTKNTTTDVVVRTSTDNNSAILSVFNSGAGSGNFAQFRAYGNTTGGTLFGSSTNKMISIFSNVDSIFTIGTISATPIVFGTANSERFRITGGGNILMGTTTDAGQRVQIDSSLRLVPTSTVPTASAGAMYYDSATNKLKLYDGTNWVDLN